MITNLYTAAFERQRLGSNAIIKEAITIRDRLGLVFSDYGGYPGRHLIGVAYSPLLPSGWSLPITDPTFTGSNYLYTSTYMPFTWALCSVEATWTNSNPSGGSTATAFSVYNNSNQAVRFFYDFNTLSWVLRVTDPTLYEVSYPVTYNASSPTTRAFILEFSVARLTIYDAATGNLATAAVSRGSVPTYTTLRIGLDTSGTGSISGRFNLLALGIGSLFHTTSSDPVPHTNYLEAISREHINALALIHAPESPSPPVPFFFWEGGRVFAYQYAHGFDGAVGNVIIYHHGALVDETVAT